MGLSGIWSDRISKGGFNKNNKNTQQYFQVAFGFTLLPIYKKVKCLVFEKITLFWANLCGYNLYSRLKAVTLR